MALKNTTTKQTAVGELHGCGPTASAGIRAHSQNPAGSDARDAAAALTAVLWERSSTTRCEVDWVGLWSDDWIPSLLGCLCSLLFFPNPSEPTYRSTSAGRLSRRWWCCCCQNFRWHGFLAPPTDWTLNKGNDWEFPSLPFIGNFSLVKNFFKFFLSSSSWNPPPPTQATAMQQFTSTDSNSSTLPRDGELQLRLADSGGPGEGRENGAGTHFLRQPEEESSLCTKRRMLIGLDLLCLFVGKCGCIVL